MNIKDKYGSVENYIYEVFVIPAISLGVSYETIMQLTPFILLKILKGKQRERILNQQMQDSLNYAHAIYVLGGLSGHLPDKPFYSEINLEGASSSQIDEGKSKYEKKQAQFITIMTSINNNFKGKEKKENV